MRYHMVRVSQNAKLGPIPSIYSSRETCPSTCPLKDAGCYADHGNIRLHWNRVTASGVSIDSLCAQIKTLPKQQLYRYAVAGDLPPTPEDRQKLATANAGRPVIVFTHHRDQQLVRDLTAQGFHVNYSCDNLNDVDNVAADISAVVVVPSTYQRKKSETVAEFRKRLGGKLKMRTPKGRPVALCPATYLDETTCSSCGLCASFRRNGTVIAFPAHGARHRTIDRAYPSNEFNSSSNHMESDRTART
jgi:hypothetical protein